MIFQRSFITSVCVLWLLMAKIYTQDTKDTLQQNENSQHVMANLSNGTNLLQIPTFVKSHFQITTKSINKYNHLQENEQQSIRNQTKNFLFNYKSANYHANTSAAHELNKFEFVKKIPINANILASAAGLSNRQKNIATRVLFQLDALQAARPNVNILTSQSQQHKIYGKEYIKHQKSNFECFRELQKDLIQSKESVYDLLKNTLDKVQFFCSLFKRRLKEVYLENNTGHRQGRKKSTKLMKKLRKLFLPLLLAYKLKFLTLIPLLIAGLVLLVGTTGLAGFFFALFAAVMTLKIAGSTQHDVMVKG